MRTLVVLLMGIISGGVFATVQLLHGNGLLSAFLVYSLTGSAAMLVSALAFAFRQSWNTILRITRERSTS